MAIEEVIGVGKLIIRSELDENSISKAQEQLKRRFSKTGLDARVSSLTPTKTALNQLHKAISDIKISVSVDKNSVMAARAYIRKALSQIPISIASGGAEIKISAAGVGGKQAKADVEERIKRYKELRERVVEVNKAVAGTAAAINIPSARVLDTARAFEVVEAEANQVKDAILTSGLALEDQRKLLSLLGLSYKGIAQVVESVAKKQSEAGRKSVLGEQYATLSPEELVVRGGLKMGEKRQMLDDLIRLNRELAAEFGGAAKQIDKNSQAYKVINSYMRGFKSEAQAAASASRMLIDHVSDVDGVLDRLASAMSNAYRETGYMQMAFFALQMTGMNIQQITRGVFREIVTGSLEAASSIRSAEYGLVKFTGSVLVGKQIMKDLQEIAARTRYEFAEILPLAQQMMAQGFKATNLVSSMEKILNYATAAGASMEDLQGIVRALGQMFSSVNARAQEMNQLIQHSVEPYEMIARQLGKTEREVRQLLEAGGIEGAKAAELIIEEMGRRGEGAVAELANTYAAAMGNMRDSITLIRADFGEWLEEHLHISQAINYIANQLANLSKAAGVGGIAGGFAKFGLAVAGGVSALGMVTGKLFEFIGILGNAAFGLRNVSEAWNSLRNIMAAWRSSGGFVAAFKGTQGILGSIAVLIDAIKLKMSGLITSFRSLPTYLQAAIAGFAAILTIIGGVELAMQNVKVRIKEIAQETEAWRSSHEAAIEDLKEPGFRVKDVEKYIKTLEKSRKEEQRRHVQRIKEIKEEMGIWNMIKQGAKYIGIGVGVGALAGGEIGSFVPVIGTTLGAVIGAVISGIGGIIGFISQIKGKRKELQAEVEAIQRVNKYYHDLRKEAEEVKEAKHSEAKSYDEVNASLERQAIAAERAGETTRAEIIRAQIAYREEVKKIKDSKGEEEDITERLALAYDKYVAAVEKATEQGKQKAAEFVAKISKELDELEIKIARFQAELAGKGFAATPVILTMEYINQIKEIDREWAGLSDKEKAAMKDVFDKRRQAAELEFRAGLRTHALNVERENIAEKVAFWERYILALHEKGDVVRAAVLRARLSIAEDIAQLILKLKEGLPVMEQLKTAWAELNRQSRLAELNADLQQLNERIEDINKQITSVTDKRQLLRDALISILEVWSPKRAEKFRLQFELKDFEEQLRAVFSPEEMARIGEPLLQLVVQAKQFQQQIQEAEVRRYGLEEFWLKNMIKPFGETAQERIAKLNEEQLLTLIEMLERLDESSASLRKMAKHLEESSTGLEKQIEQLSY